MKTALDCLLFELNRRMDIIQKETTEIREDMINNLISGLDDFKEKEKQQIIDAYQEGVVHGNEYFPGDDSFAQKYFNQTYLSNENT
jgi:hypothetical protein